MDHTDISRHIANGRRLRAAFIRRHPQVVFVAVALAAIVVCGAASV
jgi:hypothetical protein